MDSIERAQRYEERERQAAIAVCRKHSQTESLKHCVDCGEDIPEQRRAIGGIRRCIDCQQEKERRQQ